MCVPPPPCHVHFSLLDYFLHYSQHYKCISIEMKICLSLGVMSDQNSQIFSLSLSISVPKIPYGSSPNIHPLTKRETFYQVPKMEDFKEGERGISNWRTLVKRGPWTRCVLPERMTWKGFVTQMMDLRQILQATRYLEGKAGSGEESCSPVQLHTQSSLSHHTHKSPLIPVSAHMSMCQNLAHACRSQLDQTILITNFLWKCVTDEATAQWWKNGTVLLQSVIHAVIFPLYLGFELHSARLKMWEWRPHRRHYLQNIKKKKKPLKHCPK